MTTTRKNRGLVVALACALVFAAGPAGCAGKENPKVATADPGGGDSSAAPRASSDRSALRFARCMREQGLTWYPDPDSAGGLKVSVPDGTDQVTVDKAETACEAFAPWAGGPGDPIPAEDLTKIRQVSQCMRDKGFSKYPDPDANGSLSIDSQQLGVEPDDPAFQKARQECDKLMPAPKNKAN
jgi:hypothetical protein